MGVFSDARKALRTGSASLRGYAGDVAHNTFDDMLGIDGARDYGDNLLAGTGPVGAAAVLFGNAQDAYDRDKKRREDQANDFQRRLEEMQRQMLESYQNQLQNNFAPLEAPMQDPVADSFYQSTTNLNNRLGGSADTGGLFGTLGTLQSTRRIF